MRVHALLKQASANAASTSTQDQASDHSAQTNSTREEFKLEVTESAPTSDQLRSILEYVGVSKVGSVITGAKNEADAVRKFRSNDDSFQRPVVCSMLIITNCDVIFRLIFL